MVEPVSKTIKELTYEWFEQVWNHGDEEHIRRQMATNVVLKGLRIPENSVSAFVAFQRMFQATFEEIWVDFDYLFEVDDAVMGLANFTAIHRKTRRPVNFACSIYKVWKDGKIVESQNVIDFMALMEQVGVLDKSLFPTVFAEAKS